MATPNSTTMNPQKKSIPKSNQTNSKMPYPSLPLSTGQSKKKKKKTQRTQNSKPADPPRSSDPEPPQPTTTCHDPHRFKTQPTQPDLKDPQTHQTHARLERPITHDLHQTWESHDSRRTWCTHEPWRSHDPQRRREAWRWQRWQERDGMRELKPCEKKASVGDRLERVESQGDSWENKIMFLVLQLSYSAILHLE